MMIIRSSMYVRTVHGSLACCCLLVECAERIKLRELKFEV